MSAPDSAWRVVSALGGIVTGDHADDGQVAIGDFASVPTTATRCTRQLMADFGREVARRAEATERRYRRPVLRGNTVAAELIAGLLLLNFDELADVVREVEGLVDVVANGGGLAERDW